MKTSILATFIWLALTGSCLAKADTSWKNGKLILTNGTELTGSLNYNWKAEIIQLKKSDGTIKAFSPYQVRSFSYFDPTMNELRHFSSIDYPVKPTLNRQVFLEELSPGSMTIYRRLRHFREPLKIARTASYSNDNELVKDYDNFQYIIFTNDKFVSLDDFHFLLWPQMQAEFGNEMREYIKARELDTTQTVMRLMIIAQYNQLKSAKDMSTEQDNKVETTGVSVE